MISLENLFIQYCDWCWAVDSTCSCKQEYQNSTKLVEFQNKKLQERLDKVKNLTFEEQFRFMTNGRCYHYTLFMSPYTFPEVLKFGLNYWIVQSPSQLIKSNATKIYAYVKDNPVFGLLLLETPELSEIFK